MSDGPLLGVQRSKRLSPSSVIAVPGLCAPSKWHLLGRAAHLSSSCLRFSRILDSWTTHICAVRHRHDTRTHRIEVNGVDQPQKRPALLYHQALIPRLKNMPS